MVARLFRRVENWDVRLVEAIDRHSRHAFDWGKFDCFTLPREAVLAMTGQDITEGLRWHYSTQFGAVRALRRQGARTVAEWFSSFSEPVPLLLASRGDLVTLGDMAAGIVVGGCVATRTAQGPVALVPLSLAKTVHKV
jgi:hypothetical protein